MKRKVTDKRLGDKNGGALQLLCGGRKDGVLPKGRVAGEARPQTRRQFVPAKELAEALADVPSIDYAQLRSDIDAFVDQDPSPRYWVD